MADEDNEVEGIEEDEDFTGFQVILDEIQEQTKRASKAKFLEAKNEMANTIFPLMERIVTWANDNFLDLMDEIDSDDEDDEEPEELTVAGTVPVATELLQLISITLDSVSSFLETFEENPDQAKPLVEPIRKLIEEIKNYGTKETDE